MQNSSARVIPFVYATFSLNINRSIQMNFISVPSSFLLYERMLNDLAEFLFQRFVRSFVFIHLSPISKMCSMKQKIAQVGKIRTFRWNSLCSSKQSFLFYDRKFYRQRKRVIMCHRHRKHKIQMICKLTIIIVWDFLFFFLNGKINSKHGRGKRDSRCL